MLTVILRSRAKRGVSKDERPRPGRRARIKSGMLRLNVVLKDYAGPAADTLPRALEPKECKI